VSPQPIAVGEHKPKELLEFSWINTVFGNLKSSFAGAYHAFDHTNHDFRYPAAWLREAEGTS